VQPGLHSRCQTSCLLSQGHRKANGGPGCAIPAGVKQRNHYMKRAVQRESFAEPKFYWSYHETLNRAWPRSRLRGGEKEKPRTAKGTSNPVPGEPKSEINSKMWAPRRRGGFCRAGLSVWSQHQSRELLLSPGAANHQRPAPPLCGKHTGLRLGYLI